MRIDIIRNAVLIASAWRQRLAPLARHGDRAMAMGGALAHAARAGWHRLELPRRAATRATVAITAAVPDSAAGIGFDTRAMATHFERAQRCREAACQRVDAALYELARLHDDLAAVVDPAALATTSRLIEQGTRRARAEAAVEPGRLVSEGRAAAVRAGRAAGERSAA